MSSLTPAGSGGIVAQDSSTLTARVAAAYLMPTAGTAYAVVLPVGTKQVQIKVLGVLPAAFWVSNTALDLDEYFPRGTMLVQASLLVSTPLTLYLVADTDAQTAELVYWT